MQGGHLVPQQSESLHEMLLKIIVEDSNRKHEESLKRYKEIRRQKMVKFTQIGLKEKKEMAMVVSQSIEEMKKRKQQTRYKAQAEQIIRQAEKKEREESTQFKIKEYLAKIAKQKQEQAKELVKSQEDRAKQQSLCAQKDEAKNQTNKTQNKPVQNKASIKVEPQKYTKQIIQGNSQAELFQSKDKSKNPSIFSFSKQFGDKTEKVQDKGGANPTQQSKPKQGKNQFSAFEGLSSSKSPFNMFTNTTPAGSTPDQSLFPGTETSLQGNTRNNKRSQPNFLQAGKSNNIFTTKDQSKPLNPQFSTPLFSMGAKTNSIFNFNHLPQTKNIFGLPKDDTRTPSNIFKRQQQSRVDPDPCSPEAKQKLASNSSNSMLFGGPFGMKSSSSKEFVLNSINGSSPSSIVFPSPK